MSDLKIWQLADLTATFIYLATNFAMIVIGTQYNLKENCPKYLLIGGGLCLATNIVKLINILTTRSSRISDVCSSTFCLIPLIHFLSLLCVTIWGSAVIFGELY